MIIIIRERIIIYNIEYLTLFVLIVFTFAGIVKGIIGMGLPTISLVVMTLILDIETAITMIVIPSFVTNLWQALTGKHLRDLIREFWFFLILSGLSVYIGTTLFFKMSNNVSTLLLALIIIFYSIIVLSGKKISFLNRNLFINKSVIFSSNGILAGLTGTLIVPGVFYFQSLNFKKEKLLQALGIHFSILSLFLGFSKSYHKTIFDFEILFLSLASCVSAFIGIFVGRVILKRINEKMFRKIFLFSLLIIGILILIKAYIN